MMLSHMLASESVVFNYIAWGDLLDDLNEAEYADASIARLLNLPVMTVRSWRSVPEREPRFCAGMALLNLHAGIFGDDNTLKRIQSMHDTAIRATVNSHRSPANEPNQARSSTRRSNIPRRHPV